MDYTALLASCAPLVAPSTAHAVIKVESGGNPYAIGVIGARLQRQPQNRAEAIATAKALAAAGWNFDLGLGQINKANLPRLGMSIEGAFDVCTNLKAMQTILSDCYTRATKGADQQTALLKAFSCYNSGNFRTGFERGYVNRVLVAWKTSQRQIQVAAAPTR